MTKIVRLITVSVIISGVAIIAAGFSVLLAPISAMALLALYARLEA